ncbi:MAG: IS4 family transposase, partial [Desulfobacteria bacterium]
ETGAMRRARGEITSPDVLLQVLLMHVATGLSLKQAAARAKVQGLASITDVALLKRLRSSEPWLRELARRMFETSRFARVTVTRELETRRLRAVDATTVQEPGATGTDWRVHYSISLPEMRCDFYEVTDDTGGETYKRIPVQPGDIILGDRGYCHREGVAHVLNQKGDVIVRLNSTSFPLLEAKRDVPLGLLAHLRRLRGHQPGEWSVRFEAVGTLWSARLCAVRKSRQAAERAKKKIVQQAAKNQVQLRPETIELAEYVYVLVSLDRDVLDAREALELYRARWQIELCFKRLKSLFQLGHVPKRNDESARAWIEGKLLTVMLIERLLTEAKLFPPWGFEIQATPPLAGIPRGT